jgi:mono/diheme cytochrome c family protein
MKMTRWRGTGSVSLCFLLAVRVGASPPPVAPPVDGKAVLDKYCVTCHNDRLKTAGLSLAQVDFQDVGKHSDALERVVRKLQAASMPPPGAPRPDKATYLATAAWLTSRLDQAAVLAPNAGRVAGLHRLNRAEYKNVMRDLLGVEGLDVSQMLPSDDASYGFDNIASTLGISPTHLERYLTAARKIARIAVGDTTIPVYGETQMIPNDLSQDMQLEGLPMGTRGGRLVRRYFPVDGDYLLRFQTVTGIGVSEDEPNFVEVTVDGARVFYTQVEQRKAIGNDDEASTNYEVRLAIKAGSRDVGITFLETTVAQPEDVIQPYLRPPGVSTFKHARLGGYAGSNVALLSFTGPVSVAGPGDSPSRRRIFVCHPTTVAEEAPCARRILRQVARRAYRRPVMASEVDTLLEFFTETRVEGNFDHGIRVALQRVLTSPDFLFRVEQQPKSAVAGKPYRISDLELASRLSFFLWSSIPDDQLLDLAVANRLHRPDILTSEVSRMLRDERSSAFVENFAGQWLRLRNIKAAIPDTRMFPNFDDNLRIAFKRETELFFTSVINEDRSALDLINADYSFLNERLARHYGVPNIYGSQFRRVTFTNGQRGGLLGHGSVLLATSQANRTSPVVRGKWILENLLGTPPPSPPADVPSLEETPVQGTLRQRMEQHRKNPVCAACHTVMDPLGFALENYDPVGAWRTHEGATPVDVEGAMPDGTVFNGVLGLRKALTAEPEIFLTALTEKMMIYATGRGMEGYDRPALRAIVRKAAANDYRFSSFIMGIVNSLPFQLRQALPLTPLSPTATSARR